MTESQLLAEVRKLRQRVEDLIGAVAHWQMLAAVTQNQGHKVSVIAKRKILLHDYTKAADQRRQKAEIIFAHVAAKFNLPAAIVLGACRTNEVSRCRHIGLAIARGLLGWTSMEASRFIGRNHAAVYNSYEKVAAMRQTEPKIDALYRELEAELLKILDGSSRRKEALNKPKNTSAATDPHPRYRHD